MGGKPGRLGSGVGVGAALFAVVPGSGNVAGTLTGLLFAPLDTEACATLIAFSMVVGATPLSWKYCRIFWDSAVHSGDEGPTRCAWASV